jgi:hypothetical protein
LTSLSGEKGLGVGCCWNNQRSKKCIKIFVLSGQKGLYEGVEP